MFNKVKNLPYSIDNDIHILMYSFICKGLVNNYGEGGLQNGRGGHVKFYPYKRGGRKSFSHAEGGAQKVLG